MSRNCRSALVRAVLCLSSLALGVVIGVFAERYFASGITRRYGITRNDVIEFCRDADASAEGWSVQEMQRTPHFLHIQENLDEYLSRKDELTGSGTGLCLTTLIWRAALVAGDDRQLSEALNISALSGDRVQVIWDIAGHFPRATSPSNVLHGIETEPLACLLNALADRAPSDWGCYDFTPDLLYFMRNDARDDIRLRAAYCLARWGGEGEVGEEATLVLRDADKQGKWLGTALYGDLRSLGRHGWKHPRLQTTQTAGTRRALE